MEKSKSNLSTYVSDYVLIIQKLGKVFLREILFSVAEPGKKKPSKTSSINSRGTRRLGGGRAGEVQKHRSFLRREKIKIQLAANTNP